MSALLHSNEDYAAFIDKNVHKFLPKFNGYGVNPTTFHPGWNWAAFFFSFWWFLYRKMYLWAIISFLTLCLPYFNLLILIGWGVAANELYYRHANTKISEIKGHCSNEYAMYLRDAGGVNSWVPWVALLVSSGLFVLALLFGVLGMIFAGMV